MLRPQFGVEIFDEKLNKIMEDEENIYICSKFLTPVPQNKINYSVEIPQLSKEELKSRNIVAYDLTSLDISENDFGLVIRCLHEDWIAVAEECVVRGQICTFIKYLALFGIIPIRKPNFSRINFTQLDFDKFASRSVVPFEFVGGPITRCCGIQIIGRSAFLLISQIDVKYRVLHLAVTKEFARQIRIVKTKFLPEILGEFIKFPAGVKLHYSKKKIICSYVGMFEAKKSEEKEHSGKKNSTRKLIIKFTTFEFGSNNCFERRVFIDDMLYSSFAVCRHAILGCDLRFLCGQYNIYPEQITRKSLKEIKMLRVHGYHAVHVPDIKDFNAWDAGGSEQIIWQNMPTQCYEHKSSSSSKRMAQGIKEEKSFRPITLKLKDGEVYVNEHMVEKIMSRGEGPLQVMISCDSESAHDHPVIDLSSIGITAGQMEVVIGAFDVKHWTDLGDASRGCCQWFDYFYLRPACGVPRVATTEGAIEKINTLIKNSINKKSKALRVRGSDNIAVYGIAAFIAFTGVRSTIKEITFYCDMGHINLIDNDECRDMLIERTFNYLFEKVETPDGKIRDAGGFRRNKSIMIGDIHDGKFEFWYDDLRIIVYYRNNNPVCVLSSTVLPFENIMTIGDKFVSPNFHEIMNRRCEVQKMGDNIRAFEELGFLMDFM